MENYYGTRPKKRMGAGVLIFNDQGEILIVKPTYKDHWSIPGGVIDKDESPRQARIREVEEEIGLKLDISIFVAVGHTLDLGPKGESPQFIFYGGELTDTQAKSIKLPEKELSEHRFLSVEKALPLLNPKLQLCIPKCIDALKRNVAVYLENGII